MYVCMYIDVQMYKIHFKSERGHWSTNQIDGNYPNIQMRLGTNQKAKQAYKQAGIEIDFRHQWMKNFFLFFSSSYKQKRTKFKNEWDNR